MSDGFRSAEIGAPVFTFTSACKPGCSAQSGHAADCAAHPRQVVYMAPISAGSVFGPAGGFVWPAAAPPARAACPHCGGDLGNATIINSGPPTFTAT
jgi:hypothetical protein